jgi:hypothetical protein
MILVNSILEKVELNFPEIARPLIQELENFFWFNELLKPINNNFYPFIEIKTLPKKNLTVNFCTTKECLSIDVVNQSGTEWESKYSYVPISFDEFKGRSDLFKIKSIDYLGVNLPWKKEDGVHPTILNLRDKLKSSCLYYLFPTGETRDFIIPGTKNEILQQKPVDYTLTRKPKFELVSFEGSSMPLVQIDLAVDSKYSYFKKIFPEAILFDDIKSAWVYLKTEYYFDICIVLNESSKHDWGKFFIKSRLV